MSIQRQNQKSENENYLLPKPNRPKQTAKIRQANGGIREADTNYKIKNQKMNIQRQNQKSENEHYLLPKPNKPKQTGGIREAASTKTSL